MAILALGLLASASEADAATWNVTTTADTALGDANCLPSSCSLRQALDASSPGDTVVLPASSTPYLVSSGQLGVGDAITIEGSSQAGSVIEATAGNDNRVMLVYGNAAAVTLKNLTITGGDTATSGKSGGGIAVGGPGALVLDHVAVTGNTVDTTNAAPDFNQGGGGIYSLASLILNGSTVSDNTVNVPTSEGDGGGGGILMAQTTDNSDNLTITDSTVSDNTATVAAGGGATDANGGGGIYADGGNLTISASRIEDNTAAVSSATTNTSTPTDGGGGIFQFGNLLVLSNSTVDGNVAHGPGIDRGGGGGVLDSGNGSQYLNSTVTGNSTDEPSTGDMSDGGGGILLNNVKDGVTIANMTITGNSASAATGGGINNELSTTADVTDSIIAGNTAADTNGNCAGGVVSYGFNLTDDSTGNNSCALTATGDILGAAPRLGALADNGGPTPTEALLAGSPAIDTGDPVGCTDLLGDPLTTDQRGAARPAGASGRCDIGAYELALPAVSTSTATVAGGGVTLTAMVREPDPRPATVTFQYGPTAAYGSSTTAQTVVGVSGPQTFSALVSGLAPGTYHFRVVATNPDGMSSGADGVFTIAWLSPVAAAHKPARVRARSATLEGTVNPESQRTGYHFEFTTRLTGGFRRKTRTRWVPAGSAVIGVAAPVTKLEAGKVYRYRLIATNGGGTAISASGVFRTPRRRRARIATSLIR